MKMRITGKGVSWFLLVMGLYFLGSGVALPAEKHSFDLYCYVSRSHSFTQEMIKFAEDVKAKSEGRLDIRVFGVDEITYKGNEFLRLMRTKAVDMVQMLPSYVAGDAPLLVGPDLPFLNSKRDYRVSLEMYKALGNLADEELAKWNSVVLSRWTYPEQDVWFRSPVESIDGWKGKKIRTYGPDLTAAMEAIGAAGVTMAAGEVYTALQRGVMDGAYTAPVTMLTMHWYEVCKQGWRVQAAFPVDHLLINSDKWGSLSKDLQNILKESAVKLAERCQGYSVGDLLNGQLGELKKNGVAIRDVSAEEFATLSERAEPAWYVWAKRVPHGEEALKRMAKVAGRDIK
jgi:TRAP-type C4-dicarboxylate transport system substrate-binding protein